MPQRRRKPSALGAGRKRPAKSVRVKPRITSMAMPRLGDMLRAEPNLLQGAAMGTLDSLQRALAQYNGLQGAAGIRLFDYPGRPSLKKRRVTRVKGGFRKGVKLNPGRVTDLRGVPKSQQGKYRWPPVGPPLPPGDRLGGRDFDPTPSAARRQVRRASRRTNRPRIG